MEMEELVRKYRLLDGYKVVQPAKLKEDLFYSALAPIKTKYRILDWCIREIGNGPFSIFTDLTAAKEFRRAFSHLGLVVFRCKYIKSKHTGYWISDVHKRALHFTNRDFADAVLLISKVYAYQSK